MAILSKGTTFGSTEQVTSTKLNNLVDAATFVSGGSGTCETGGGLNLSSNGRLQIEDGEVDLVKLSTNNALNSGLYGVLDKVYPVGSIYIATVSTNPDTLMFGGSGHTTWAAFGAGKTLVGIDSGDTDFDTSEETGGVKSVTLTAAQSGLPSHSHTLLGGGFDGSSGAEPGNSLASDLGQTGTTGGTDASQAHTNLQPYIVTYMWKRTA